MGRLTVKDKPKYQVGWDGTISKYYLTKTHVGIRLVSKKYRKIIATRKLRGSILLNFLLRSHFNFKVIYKWRFTILFFFQMFFLGPCFAIVLSICFSLVVFVYHAFINKKYFLFGTFSFGLQIFFILFYLYLPHFLYFN